MKTVVCTEDVTLLDFLIRAFSVIGIIAIVVYYKIKIWLDSRKEK